MAIKVGLVVVICLLLAGLFLACQGDIKSKEARKLVKQGALLLDVRTTGEFAQGHLPNAKNIPVASLAKRLSELPSKTRPIIVYCQSGVRSRRAARLLKAKGFRVVRNLGGMSNWK